MRFAQVEPTRLSVLAGLLGKTRRCVGRMSFGASGRTWSDCVRKPATDPARRFGLADWAGPRVARFSNAGRVGLATHSHLCLAPGDHQTLLRAPLR